MASMTTLPSIDGRSPAADAAASQRSAKMTASAPLTASAGEVARAPGVASSAVRVLSLSGSLTPYVIWWPARLRPVPSPPPTFPAPMIAIFMRRILHLRRMNG
jgi:hypothetical protein